MGTDYSHLQELEGLQFMPVKKNKQPIVKGWQSYDGKHDLTNCEGVGLVCGALSGNLEAIDCDVKYSLDGKLFENYKKAIHEADNKLLEKLVVQKTKGGGYHLIFRCKKIAGNLKLANRPTTEQERQETYDKTYASEILKGDDAQAVDRAKKAAKNDNVRVLLETRGTGGFIMCYPSKGYELIHRDFYGINEITEEEREMLFTIARSFNEVFEEVHTVPKSTKTKYEGLSPFEDYNERGDVVGLLESYGWKIVGQKGRKTIFLRPGQTTSQSSGNYDHEKGWFSVFTTSTEFEPQKAYRPYAVYAVLECNKDFSAAAKKLLDLGYGEKKTAEKKEYQSTRVIQSRINVEDDDLSFLAKPEDYEEYLQQVKSGTLPMGLTTGSPALDEHFLFKAGNLVMVNGTDNVGKTKFVWYLQLIAALYHGWKGIVFASENTLGSFMRAMIQFYWGKPLYSKYGHAEVMNEAEYAIAKDFVEKHFWQIKAQEDLYNYKDILNMIRKARKKYPQINHAMIDPYNSLKIDLSGFSKLNTHEYHYEALSEMKAYGQQTKFGFFINHHAITAAARAKDGERKYPVAPQKADTEGGAKVANKADDFLTIHRLGQHPTEWNITEVHVRKIKDTETGGRQTPLDNPVKFEMYKNSCGFFERLDFGGQPVDPIQSWHNKNQPKQQKLITGDDIYKNPFLEQLGDDEEPFPYIK